MSIDLAQRRYNQLLNTVGRSALNALYPYDIEVYLMALELVDSNGDTIDYLAFPIMPDSITKTEPKRTNIKKTVNGITVLSSNTYIPEEIIIKGNFGRNFKILISPKEPGVNGVAFSTSRGVYDLTTANSFTNSLVFRPPFFNIGIKTGYGAFRILKAIISKANGIDKNGKPFRLFLYNLALGESHLVAVSPAGFVGNQSVDKNMIWQYTLNLTTLAPLEALKSELGQSSLGRVLSTNVIQQGVNTVANELVNVVL